MKKVLIISFDFITKGESRLSLSIASLIAFLKNDKGYENEFMVDHLSFNMYEVENYNDIFYLFNSINDIENYETIALACYIWSEYLINPLIKKFRSTGFRNKIVLGGYQITYADRERLRLEYPDCDIFIIGYAEVSLLESINAKITKGKHLILEKDVDFTMIPSPYLTKVIHVSEKQYKVRLETKRGCPYECPFCAHRDLTRNKVYNHNKNKVFKELAFLKEKQVKKINIIDPVFNQGKYYLDIMNEIIRINLDSTITFQAKIELIEGEKGDNFLDLASRINSHLEFGIQSINDDECKIINRKNNIELITKTMNKLNERNISYEISLIYGLPNQTLDTFKKNIDFLYSNGCNIVKAFPLILLKGTQLYYQKEKLRLREDFIGKFNIPFVVESNSFSRNDWQKMDEIAKKINNRSDFQT